MRVKLCNGGAATSADLAQLEAAFGPLPASYKDFVSIYDGAEAQPNIFRVSPRNECGVNAFIKIRDIQRESKQIENLDQAFPIAYTEGGNYVLLDLAKHGEVQFWDHEQPDEPAPIACDFQTFLDLLEPFDMNAIRLKPGQVKSAWIDPNFLKGLE